MSADTRTVLCTCTLCEALCGVKIEVQGQSVLSILPDNNDVFSRGHICPKGAALGELHHDPDRLRTPVRRLSNGDFAPISWEEAFRLVAERLTKIRREHGADAIASYFGNPIIHSQALVALRGGLMKAIGSRNVMSASSQDTMPRFAAAQFLFGCSISIPVPDIDNTDYFLCIGANPLVSNGSLLTAPGMRQRLHAMQQRGARVVVVDPIRTETAKVADEHLAILPGGDAMFLLALTSVLLDTTAVDEKWLLKHTSGWLDLKHQLASFKPERVAAKVGLPAETIRRVAHDFSHAQHPVAYSRVGVCNNRHGTLASVATDLLNLVAGRLGKVGGSMFPRPVVDLVPTLLQTGDDGHNRWQSRVRRLPETMGEIPASTLAEEIETPGPGQVRALLAVAGNPVLSTPNGPRLEKALQQLDFFVAVDCYINETTQHADVILPPASHLSDDYFDLFVARYAIRSVARWSPRVFERKPDERTDWEIVLELAYRLGGGPTGIKLVDPLFRLVRRVGLHWSPDFLTDFLIRTGPFGDRYLPWSKGLSLKKIKAAPHGLDLGPMPPGIEHGVFHRDGKIHLDHPAIGKAITELAHELDETTPQHELLLIGRRHLRSNNSWLHNLPAMVAGKPRCDLMIHPDDAERLGIRDGTMAMLESRVHKAPVPVRVSSDVRPGVVSLPHGWGHAPSARWQKVAGANPGVSINDWTDDQWVESIIGQSILNGVPVSLTPMNDQLDASRASERRDSQPQPV